MKTTPLTTDEINRVWAVLEEITGAPIHRKYTKWEIESVSDEIVDLRGGTLRVCAAMHPDFRGMLRFPVDREKVHRISNPRKQEYLILIKL